MLKLVLAFQKISNSIEHFFSYYFTHLEEHIRLNSTAFSCRDLLLTLEAILYAELGHWDLQWIQLP